MCFLLVACSENRVFIVYEDVAIEGWEKNDMVTIAVPPLMEDGVYDIDLLLRRDNSFPYKNISLLVETTVFPSESFYRDTLNCELSDNKGKSLGYGINLYQHSFPIQTRNLCVGDSVHINIRHNMMREILPGVSNIGILVRKR